MGWGLAGCCAWIGIHSNLNPDVATSKGPPNVSSLFALCLCSSVSKGLSAAVARRDYEPLKGSGVVARHVRPADPRLDLGASWDDEDLAK